MLYLLNPRLWAVLAVLAGLLFSNVWSYRHGKRIVLAEWNEAKAAAIADARKLETLRQSRVDEAARLAAARESRIRADAARARDAASGLRDDLNAVRLHAQSSLNACTVSLTAATDVFESCVRAYTELAQEADLHASDSLKLQMSWPKE